jgi:dUTP pyrophosphatase
MKIKKVRDVKTPQRGTQGSAGIDFFVPNDYIAQTLKNGESALIPSGIKAQIPKGYALIAFSKSGVATKKQLAIGACVVDEDYTGEIHLHVYNWSNTETTIQPGEKLVQFILTPVLYAEIEVCEELEFEQTERGEGGFGSTGIGIDKPIIEQSMIERIPGVVANLIHIEPVKKSQRSGYYQRHTFRDVDNPNQTYILDLSAGTKSCFHKLSIGDTFMGLDVFTHSNDKMYINGKYEAQYLGKIATVRDLLIKPKAIKKGLEELFDF